MHCDPLVKQTVGLSLTCRPELTERIILPHTLCETRLRHGFKAQPRPELCYITTHRQKTQGLTFPISIPLRPQLKDHTLLKLLHVGDQMKYDNYIGILGTIIVYCSSATDSSATGLWSTVEMLMQMQMCVIREKWFQHCCITLRHVPLCRYSQRCPMAL